MDTIVQLLDEMEGYLQDCSSVPFSNKKIVVDMEILYDFMTDLRMKLPEEVKRSKRILDEKTKIVKEAKEIAKQTEEETKIRLRQLLDEHEVRKQAEAEANEIVNDANQEANEIANQAYSYAQKLLEQAEGVLRDTIHASNRQYEQYHKYMEQQIQVIQQSRDQLKD